MDLKTSLAPYVQQVEHALLTSLQDVTPERLRDACVHYPRAGGKRLRPAVALLAFEAAGGGDRARAVPIAVALELVHNFSLVHDDIMDRDDTRRGIPTVHVKWGEPTAILAGDTLFAKAYEVLADSDLPPEALQRVILDVATMGRVLCEGQELDMAFEARDATPEEYLDMIYRKTARIFEVAARCGALAALGVRGEGGNGVRSARVLRAGAHEPMVLALSEYGRHLGMAFQVKDDLLDLLSTTEEMGKPQGSDVRKGKKTVVYLHAKANASPGERAVLAGVMGRAEATDEEVQRVIAVFRRTGALARAEALVKEHTQGALAALDALPATPARDVLRALAAYAESRRS